MKKHLFILGLALALFNVGCDDQNTIPNGYVQTTQEGASTLVLKGYENAALGFSVFQPEGFDSPFYIQDKKFAGNAYSFTQVAAARLDEMTTVPANVEWQSNATVTAGAAYWARYAASTVYRFVKFRVSDINGNNVTIEYVVTDQTEERPNDNVNANTGYDNVSVTGYEIPHLNDQNVYADHYVTMDGVQILNYALEWDNTKRHANWVAFTFDTTTSADNVKRTDAWSVDPKLPAEMQVQESDHKNDGFDKGHLCASEDRVYLKEANEQTFYYSNMSPQLNDFNGGFWGKLEARVQTWGRSTAEGVYDKVYVTKGGTLNKLLKNFKGTTVNGGTPTTDANGFTIHGLACPEYYYMAVLSQKDDVFHAIAFLVPHKEGMTRNPSSDELKEYVVSVDKLEEETGIDFFCNLPDVLENEVEAAYNLNDWAW
ncbi:DNA/RNA non-specific endonuclease [Phocaeicola coprocola]|uniref:DNA/RNA non-specific endonuclease n=1 Tax=Phocaeicola coprocola TaxID=310298 RepID=A0A921FDF4_9BACT|nr:DNA/RNA non-specific endonuclease [Phocaeicola coprocola]HJF08056.1 DNA/RNA non-specific endonuclease [Phocaeicola coprocola]